MAKSKIVDRLENLFAIATKNNWVKSYDKDMDYFCWGDKEKMKSARLYKISQEVLLYIDKTKNFTGVGITDLSKNFIEHNPGYKDIPGLFTRELESGIFTIPSKIDQSSSHKFEDLAKDVMVDVLKENLENNQSGETIDKLAGLIWAR
jgi:hypothetical protein